MQVLAPSDHNLRRLRECDVIFDVLKDFTSHSWDALLHLSTSPIPPLGKVDPELVGRGQVLMLGRFPKCRHKSGYTTPCILGAHKWATG